MSLPTFQVDFNECVSPDHVLLSREDGRKDSDGNSVTLAEGMRVKIWENDLGDDGRRDNLIAWGTVVRNTAGGWSEHVKWCCLIAPPGIMHEFEIKQTP